VGGHTIRFVASDTLDDNDYEQRIYTSGKVSTRPDNWHDLFNALVWMRYPRIKTAMNSLHYQAGAAQKSGTRGHLRDALTLFDECGVIVFSSRAEILGALAERRWTEVFLADVFRSAVALSVSGHAMLEKYLSPYKAMTAKALLVHVDADFMALSAIERMERLDLEISKQILSGRLLTEPACLSPLPLAGVPGWWPRQEQNDHHFYNDTDVFRRPAPEFTPAPVFSL
jgi:hypothetical protein